MADYVTLTSGENVATDDIGGVYFQRVKLIHGADGTNAGDVSTANGFPVQAATGAAFPVTDNGGSLTVDGTVAISGSVAVTGTFYQATQPVSIASSVAVTGPLTDTELRASAVPVSLASVPSHAVTNAGTFAVQAAQSGTWNITNVSGTVSLPTGAATAAKQPALGTAGTASSDVITVQGITGMTALKVDGSAVTQPVSGTVTANAGSGTFTVSGAVTQSGTWSVRSQDGSGNALTSATRGSERALSVQVVDASGNQVTSFGGAGGSGTEYTEGDTDASITGQAILWEDTSDTLRAVSAAKPLPIGDAGGSLTVDNGGTFAVQAAQSGTWNITNISGTVSLPTGAATAAKQPAIGTAGTASSDVLTVQGITSMTALKVDGSAVTQPVSGTFWQATQPVSLVSVPSHDVTNAGTFAVQAAQSGTWTVTGAGGTFPVTDNSGSLTIDAPVGTPVYVRLSDGASAISTLPVSLASVPSHAVTNAGTFAVQVSSALPAGTNNIGDVDVLTVPSDPFGANADAASATGSISAKLRFIASTGIPITGTVTVGSHAVTNAGTFAVQAASAGDVAHDSADSGNPIKIGAKAETSPKGITLVADGDRTDLLADADGQLIVKLGTSGADCISETVSNTDGNSTAFTNFSAVASTKNAVTAYSIFRTDSGTTMAYVDFRDGTAGSVIWRVPLPAGGGANLSQGGQPIFKTSANTALAFDVSSALTTVYISVSGFQTKV